MSLAVLGWSLEAPQTSLNSKVSLDVAFAKVAVDNSMNIRMEAVSEQTCCKAELAEALFPESSVFDSCEWGEGMGGIWSQGILSLGFRSQFQPPQRQGPKSLGCRMRS